MKRKFDVSFTLEIDVPNSRNFSRFDIREYVKDAVKGWGGGFHPTDPFFGVKEKDITYVSVKHTNRKRFLP